ncbi:hypothetical protein BTM25_47930 [Actinomadura rubteroloni]|uniref:DUF4282 domain-containing protein n=1 Tax=Actinomadura rubteroloni TaxID=1926885 RepID=A0A2P4UEY5_9ACTN|nr:DUF4282 domain-containing protein [Actinomadura rubteroloni]POM23634.1 hypothetical protein BTM25_47930 [Actinomadura rubteroloni]
MKSNSLSAALTETQFQRFVTPTIVSVLYRVTRITAGLWVSILLAVVIAFRSWLGPVATAAFVTLLPLGWVVFVMAVRVALEAVAIGFAIHAEVQRINEKE